MIRQQRFLSRFFNPLSSRRRGAAKRQRVRQLKHIESLERRELLTATPSGTNFLVSDDFQPIQRSVPEATDVAIADSGETIFVYHGRGAAGSRGAGDDREIFVQRLDGDGNQEGSPFRANAITRGDQFDPAVDAAADGSFWVVWSGRGEGDRYGVYAQRFAADGSAEGEALLVNSTVGGIQGRPDVAVHTDGSAVVVWSGVGADADFDGIFMRQINANGDLVGASETLVNSTTEGKQDHAAVAIGSSGEFVVTWSSRNEDGSDWGIFAQQFNDDGTTKGAQVAVNSTTDGSQYASDVGVAGDDSFVIGWSSNDQDGDSWGVLARRFTSAGAADGDEIQLHEDTTGHQQDVAITVADNGAFMAAWSHGAPDGAGWETFARSFETDNSPGEGTITVNTGLSGLDSGHQRFPAIDANNVGSAAVVFRGNGSADHHGVFAQRFDVEVGPAENVAPQFISVNDETVLANLTFDGVVGEQLTIRIVAEDDNPTDELTFDFDPDQSPSDAMINEIDDTTIEVVWTPDLDNLGESIPFRVTVEDNGDPMLSDAVQFIVTVDNQAPVLDLNGADQEGIDFSAILAMDAETVVVVDSDLSITDAEQGMIVSAQASITGVQDTAIEALSVDVGTTNITADYDEATSTLTLSGEDTTNNYASVLQTLTYENTAADRTMGSQRTVDVRVSDGEDDSEVATSSIQVAGINENPTLAVIEDVTLLSGSPLHIPLVGDDADGDALTFTATSNSSLVETMVLEGNRSARLSISSPTDPTFAGGEMVFELFEQRASRATNQIIQLAEDGFYNGLTFHRVIENFVIQGGDPEGDGSGGSDLDDFDDQFHPDLQHNRRGILSMAKSNDDTNNSQFFITAGDTRNLDSNHTVFGQLITGEEVRAEIAAVPVAGSTPIDEVVIDSFEIFVDEENGVLMLSAEEGASGAATIMVTASDGNGGTITRSFNVTVMPDTENSQPYLEDIPQLMMNTDSTEIFQLSAVDVEGDEIVFLDQDQLNDTGFPANTELLQPLTSEDIQYFVDPETGSLTVIASNGVTGTHQFTVGVISEPLLQAGAGRPIDLQVVEIVIS